MNVTLAMPVDLVADSRRYAAEHGSILSKDRNLDQNDCGIRVENPFAK